MVRVVLITLILLFTHALAYCQSVSVIHEYSDSKVAADMAISKEGNIFICGRYGGFAMLIKLDSNGNEQWINYYDEDYLFSKMLVDSNENIYLHMNSSIGFNNNFVLKLDSTGTEIWRSDSVVGNYTSESILNINLILHQENIFLIHNARDNHIDDDDVGISSFNNQTGQLLYQIQIEDSVDNYPYRMNEVPLKNGKWILTGYRGVLELEPSGNYNLIQMSDSVPGYLCGATSNSNITYSFKNLSEPMMFEVWRTTLFYYDNNFNLTSSKELESILYSNLDSATIYSDLIIPTKNKGLVGGGFIDIEDNGIDTSLVWFFQVNPDDGSTNWEMFMPNTAGIALINSHNENVFAIGKQAGSIGIRLYKIVPPAMSYNTQFITSTEDVVEHTKSNTTIYPNPSNAQFTLQSDLEIETISIYSIDGKLVKMIEVHSTNYSIAVDEAGVYFVNITYSNEKQETLKIIKQ